MQCRRCSGRGRRDQRGVPERAAGHERGDGEPAEADRELCAGRSAQDSDDGQWRGHFITCTRVEWVTGCGERLGRPDAGRLTRQPVQRIGRERARRGEAEGGQGDDHEPQRRTSPSVRGTVSAVIDGRRSMAPFRLM
jgi:hypothetical protein